MDAEPHGIPCGFGVWFAPCQIDKEFPFVFAPTVVNHRRRLHLLTRSPPSAIRQAIPQAIRPARAHQRPLCVATGDSRRPCRLRGQPCGLSMLRMAAPGGLRNRRAILLRISPPSRRRSLSQVCPGEHPASGAARSDVPSRPWFDDPFIECAMPRQPSPLKYCPLSFFQHLPQRGVHAEEDQVGPCILCVSLDAPSSSVELSGQVPS